MGESKQRDKKLTTRERFLTQFDEKSGYVEYMPKNNYLHNVEGWEFRFALLPDAKNIAQALQVATKVLFPEDKQASEHSYFKFFSLNAAGKSSLKAIGCEGPYVNYNAASDRDQRGKELCVYMRQTYFHGIKLFAPAAKINEYTLPENMVALKQAVMETKKSPPEIVATWKDPSGAMQAKIISMSELTKEQRVLLQFPQGEDGPKFKFLGRKTKREERILVDRIASLCGYPTKSEKTPAEWKQLILSLWKAFEESRVKFGYICPQIGDKLLPAAAGLVSPVSYVHAVKDWARITSDFWRRIAQADICLTDAIENTPSMGALIGITERLYTQYDSDDADPLEGICITYQDLTEANISPQSNLSMQIERVKYLKQHLTESLRDITGDLREEIIADKKEDSYSVIKELSSALLKDYKKNSDKPSEAQCRDFLADNNFKMQRIIRFFPMTDSEGQLVFDPSIQGLKLCTSQSSLDTTLQLADTYIKEQQRVSALRGQAKDRIYRLFAGDRNIMVYLQTLGIDASKLGDMIVADLGQMELFYRRLREIKKEKLFLYQEQHRLQEMIDFHLKAGNFSNLRWKILFPMVALPMVCIPVGTALALYAFKQLPVDMTHGLINGDAWTDSLKVMGLNTSGALIIALVGTLIYLGSRFYYDQKLIEAVTHKDAGQVASLLAKGADPKVKLPGVPAKTLWLKAVAAEDDAVLRALLIDPVSSKVLRTASMAFFSDPEAQPKELSQEVSSSSHQERVSPVS